jgi:hypothetical protein
MADRHEQCRFSTNRPANGKDKPTSAGCDFDTIHPLWRPPGSRERVAFGKLSNSDLGADSYRRYTEVRRRRGPPPSSGEETAKLATNRSSSVASLPKITSEGKSSTPPSAIVVTPFEGETRRMAF